MDGNLSQTHEAAGYGSIWRKLHGLLIAQAFGQFNDQAWKQVVTLLAMAGGGRAKPPRSTRRRSPRSRSCFRCRSSRCRPACSPTA